MNSQAVRILLVESDPAMRRNLREFLATDGFAVDEARTGEEAIESAERHPPELVLLDGDAPGMAGKEVCRSLRMILPQAGLVILSVCNGEQDKVLALEAGADDYVTKPFSVRELLARVRSIARRLYSQ